MISLVSGEITSPEGLRLLCRTRPEVDSSLPTLLFVHGAMDRGASFSRVMRRLPQFSSIALDRRGYAGSIHAGVCNSLEEHVDDLVSVIEFSGAASVVVIGHSLGGTLALGLADRCDSRVIGLGVFESPLPSLDDSYNSIGGGAIECGEQAGPEAAAEFFFKLMVGDAVWARLRERDRISRRAEGAALLAELRSLRTPGTTVDPSELFLPILVGLGTETRSSLLKSAELMYQSLPCGELKKIVGAGHGAHLSHADQFAVYVQACVEFADSQSSRRASD
ncbi:MAG: alpha/beta hydrolase [Microthrixaceae bacterium]